MNRLKRGPILLSLVSGLWSLAIPFAAFAQDSPGELVNQLYQWALGISGVLAFGAIVWGGVVYTFARGNPAGQSEGKKWISGALLGLALLGGAYLLLYTINPKIVSLDIAGLDELPSSSPGGGGETVLGSLENCTPTFGNLGAAKNKFNSSPVKALLLGSCLDQRLKDSISATWDGQHTCNITAGAASCHFGGRSCGDGAHAIDFGRNALAAKGLTVPQAASMIRLASCPDITTVRCELGPREVPCADADHIHINVANRACGCS